MFLSPGLRRKERIYEREAVLGRDAGSVFPKETAKAAREGLAAAAESIGGRSFITQSEVRLRLSFLFFRFLLFGL